MLDRECQRFLRELLDIRDSYMLRALNIEPVEEHACTSSAFSVVSTSLVLCALAVISFALAMGLSPGKLHFALPPLLCHILPRGHQTCPTS
jgi:hypothetical protein